jgi:hypothetical protein
MYVFTVELQFGGVPMDAPFTIIAPSAEDAIKGAKELAKDDGQPHASLHSIKPGATVDHIVVKPGRGRRGR